MDYILHERVMLERVELIARLVVEGSGGDRDNEVALGLIAEIARDVVDRECDQPIALNCAMRFACQ